MKTLKDSISEAAEFNLSFNTHKQVYNSFVKWYDKNASKMNKEELLDMLKTAIAEIEDGSISVAK